MRKFQKRAIVPALVTLTLLVGVTISVADEEQKKATKAPKEVTLDGEVVDLYCYMKHPEDGQGAEHTKCAQACIRKGLPVGFLSDGNLYLILGGKDHAPAAALVAEYAGVPSKLKGMLIEHNGVKSIEVTSIEPLKKASDG